MCGGGGQPYFFYSSLNRKSVAVRVEAGATAVQEVGLGPDVYRLSKFVGEGEREGNALAIAQQRNAANVKNGGSSDAFGSVADLNLGNFLMRMPGISKEDAEGEIIRVQIRGGGFEYQCRDDPWYPRSQRLDP